MRFLLVSLTSASLAVALAPAASGAPSTAEAVELQSRAGAARAETRRFTLVGLHWRGQGRVTFRTRSPAGRWTAWRAAAPEPEDGPDPSSGEAARGDEWLMGSPYWVGPSDAIETRSSGPVTRIRAHLVWSPATGVPYRVPAAIVSPAIVPRLSWGADESIRRGPPTYAPAVRFAVVHHTAGGNDYTRAEAPAVVKAIQLYHVQGNGWNDIGYNFLVDRFGTIYEGRFGGVDRNVVGAHAQGFNTGSVGIALLGTYGSTTPSRAAQDAIARLLAWRLDLAHVDPTGFATVISGGNERYGNGIPVLLRAVSGHRDAGFTECPGNLLFARLDALAKQANATGLPKLYEPRVETKGRVSRFRARLSSPLSWVVRVADGDGHEIARGAGSGLDVDWTWDATAAPPGRYSWSISSGSARPATGFLRVSGIEAPAIEDVAAVPGAISPNGDGQADTSLLTYRLTAPMNVTVEFVDAIGTVVATPVDRVWTQVGTHTVVLDGAALADGGYTVSIRGRTAAGQELLQSVPLTVSRTLGLVAVSPAAFSPNGDGRRDLLRVTFALAAAAEVRVRVFRDGRGVAALLSESMPPGTRELTWDGTRAVGPVRDGTFAASVEARDAVGAISVAVPFTADTVAPRVQVVSGRPLRLRVTEPALLVLRVNGVAMRVQAARGGVVRVRSAGRTTRVRVVAWDAAGNRSGPVTWVAPKGRSGSRE